MSKMPQPVDTTTRDTTTRDARWGRVLRWIAAIGIFGFGLLIFDRESTFWAALSLVFFTAPLVLQATPWARVRVYAIWFGVFLAIQSLIGPFIKGNYVTLPPNMHSTVDIRTAAVPGLPPGVRTITTDEKGFRVSPAVDYGKKRGKRIIAIGGSTTEDIFLDDHSTWTHLLQEGLTANHIEAEVINTGVSGLRAINHLATLRFAADYQPDLILILVGANDWNKQIRDRFEPPRTGYEPSVMRKSPFGVLLGRFVIKPLRLRLTGGASSDHHLVIERPADINADINKDRRRSRDRAIQKVFQPAGVAHHYRDEMQAISETCRTLHLACMFITQPHGYSEAAPADLRATFWMTPPYADYTLDLASMKYIADLYNNFLVDLARHNGHPVCDLAAHMEASSRNFYDDMHYTDEGARRVAEIILPCVETALRRQVDRSG